MRLSCPLFLLLAALSPLAAQETASSLATESNEPELAAPAARYDLMLLGGGLRGCSSMQPSLCLEQASFGDTVKQHNLYQLTQSQLQLLAHAKLFSEERQPLQAQVLSFLNALQEQHSEVLTATSLLDLWRSAAATVDMPLSGEALWQLLSEREQAAIFDYLEVPVLSADGKYRLTEQVDYNQFQDSISHALYQQFINLATEKAQQKGRNKAKILLVTAGSRDPFAAVDMYLDLFNQAGADAAWLPLSASYQAALRNQQCQSLPELTVIWHGSYRREQIYPDLMTYQQRWCQQGSKAFQQAILQADAIFFHGSDAHLAYLALRQQDGAASAELAAIYQALSQQQIVLAATSASSAVMSGNQFYAPAQASVPMLSNGDSYHALQYGAKAAAAPWAGCRKENRCPEGVPERQLTYQAEGGLGLFPLGILDTHFAERGRQARLVVLQQATQNRFAFGIDENTALLVDLSDWTNGRAQLSVQGAGEVVISELATDSTPARLTATMTTLSAGDHIGWPLLAEHTFTLSEKVALASANEALQSKSPIFSRQHFQQFSRSLCHSNLASATISEPPYQIKLTKLANCLQAADGKLSYRQQLRIMSPE